MWKNNLNAPRVRKDKGKVYLDNAEFAKNYLKDNPSSSIKSKKTVLEVLRLAHEKITSIAQDERDGFELPGLGVLVHLAVVPNRSRTTTLNGNIAEQYVDYVTSMKVGKLVKFTNFETDGKVLKICLSPRLVKYYSPYLRYWKFTPCREYKRASSKKFKSKFTKYRDNI